MYKRFTLRRYVDINKKGYIKIRMEISFKDKRGIKNGPLFGNQRYKKKRNGIASRPR